MGGDVTSLMCGPANAAERRLTMLLPMVKTDVTPTIILIIIIIIIIGLTSVFALSVGTGFFQRMRWYKLTNYELNFTGQQWQQPLIYAIKIKCHQNRSGKPN